MADEAAAKAAIAGNSSTAEEEEAQSAEATIVCPAVLIRPKVREGNTAAAGAGILITAAKRAARHLNMEACCRRVTVEEGGSEAQCREAGVEAEAEVTQGGRRRGRLS